MTPAISGTEGPVPPRPFMDLCNGALRASQWAWFSRGQRPPLQQDVSVAAAVPATMRIADVNCRAGIPACRGNGALDCGKRERLPYNAYITADSWR